MQLDIETVAGCVAGNVVICANLEFAGFVLGSMPLEEKFQGLGRQVGKMTNYQVGDFLIQIKNAAKATRKDVVVETSTLKKAVAQVLKREGFLSEVEEKDRELSVKLSYDHREPVILDLKLVSKPGLRIYVTVDELAKHKGGSIFIISTPKGVVSTKQALKLGMGGEVIAEIW